MIPLTNESICLLIDGAFNKNKQYVLLSEITGMSKAELEKLYIDYLKDRAPFKHGSVEENAYIRDNDTELYNDARRDMKIEISRGDQN